MAGEPTFAGKRWELRSALRAGRRAQEASRRTGRDPAEKLIRAGQELVLDGDGHFTVKQLADRDRARDDAARFLGGTYRQDFRAMVDHVAAVGDVDEVTASLQRLVDAGARHLILAPASPDATGTIERLLDEVVPRLRQVA